MLRQLFKTSALYTASAVLTRGLSLLLLPVYARVLTRSEYGVYDYLVVIGALAAVTVSLEITQAVMRFVSAPEEEGSHREYIASGFWTVVGAYSALLVVVALLQRPLTDLLLGESAPSGLLLLATGQYAAAALVQFWSVVSNANRRAWQSVLIASGSALLGGVLSVLLVTQVSAMVGSLFLGQMIGQGVVVLLVVALRRRDLRGPRLATVRQMLAFSVPLVASSLSLVSMTYLDRFFVRQLLGFEELGVYGLAARLAMGLSLILLGFQAALTPLIYGAVDDPGLPRRLAGLFWQFVGLTAVVVTVVALLSGRVVAVVGGEEFSAGGPVLSVLCAATLIQGSYIFFPGLAIAKKTWILAVVNVGGLCLNAVLNPILIDRWGLVGAALATLTSAVVVILVTARVSQRYFRVPVIPVRRSS